LCFCTIVRQPRLDFSEEGLACGVDVGASPGEEQRTNLCLIGLLQLPFQNDEPVLLEQQQASPQLAEAPRYEIKIVCRYQGRKTGIAWSVIFNCLIVGRQDGGTSMDSK
jgi:hypothetical protein